MAAKHFGHCQICGRQHKVTGMRIATHGYTIRYGWQMGACWGSRGQPYELSNGMLMEGIERARNYIASTEEQIAKLVADPLEDGKVFAAVSINYERQMRYVTLALNEKGRVEARDHAGKVARLYSITAATTVGAVARQLADAHIVTLRHAITQSLESIHFMQARYDAWKPAELTPIPAADEPAKAPTVHFQVKRYGYTTTACSASASGAKINTRKNKTTDATQVTCARCEKEVARLTAKAVMNAAI